MVGLSGDTLIEDRTVIDLTDGAAPGDRPSPGREATGAPAAGSPAASRVLGPREAVIADRFTFGRDAVVETELGALGWEAWLDRQLAPATVPDDDVDAMVAPFATLDAGNAANQALVQSGGSPRLVGELKAATWLRFLYSRRQVHEVMVDFWTNHLNTSLLGDPAYRHLPTEFDRMVIRPHALGRFADMLLASAAAPAMLVYLDNYRSDANSAAGVNENYGRELLELHTLGIIDGRADYGEDDVRAVARVLSGWSMTNTAADGLIHQYRPAYHDHGAASVLGGQWSCPAHPGVGQAGRQHGVDLLDFLAHHPGTARHLAWKLCQRFVADEPPAALVDSAAQVYLDGDTAIGPVIAHIAASPELLASARQKFRRPLDLATATFRRLGTAVDPDPVGAAVAAVHRDLTGLLPRIGQPLFERHPPDGYPDTRTEWLSADGLIRRWELVGSVAGNRLGAGIHTDLSALHPDPLPSRAGAFLDALAASLLGGGIDLDPHTFTDVPAGAWYENGVRWVAAEGVVTGYPDRTYRPRDPVNRAQMVMMLWRASGEPAGSPAGSFTDVPAGAWYRPGLDWAAAQGIVTGYPDRTYRPRDPVSRAQVAMMLFRLHADVDHPLTTVERAAVVAHLGGEAARTDAAFLAEKVPDLVGILLSLPRFQYR